MIKIYEWFAPYSCNIVPYSFVSNILYSGYSNLFLACSIPLDFVHILLYLYDYNVLCFPNTIAVFSF